MNLANYRTSIILAVTFTLLLSTFWFYQDFAFIIFLSLLLQLLLKPAVDFMERRKIPRAIAAALIAPGVDDAAARAAAGAVMGAASSLLLAWAGENNAPDAGATGTATSTAGDAPTVLSRGLLSLLGES